MPTFIEQFRQAQNNFNDEVYINKLILGKPLGFCGTKVYKIIIDNDWTENCHIYCDKMIKTIYSPVHKSIDIYGKEIIYCYFGE